MKPSLQSHFFRLVSRVMSAYLASRGGIEEWRTMAAKRDGKPSVPSGVQLQRIKIGNVVAEWLVPAQAEDTEEVILYFHGGAWIFGWYNTHRMLLGYIAKETKRRALAVDYRLAPENPFPAALDDCVAAYHYLRESGILPEQIIMAGDSSGGNLAITTMLALKTAGKPLPRAGVCISPATDLTDQFTQMNAKRDAILSGGLSDRFASILPGAYSGGHDLRDPLISPVFADLHGLPPLLVQAGEDEIMLSSITAFVNKARQAGVEVTYEVWLAMWHVWQIFTPHLREARYAVYSIARFIDK